MNRTIYLSVVLCLALGLTVQCATSQTLSLSLQLGPTSFLESQAIWAHATLVNRGTTTQQIQIFALTDDMINGIRFTLIDGRGVTVLRSVEGIMDDFGTAQPQYLAPGDSIAKMHNMLAWFSNNSDQNAPPYLPTMHYLQAGSYTLQAVQFTGKDTVRSNIVAFTIVKPSGEEGEALRVLKEADMRYYQDPHNDVVIVAYKSFLRDFPRSVYAPSAYKSVIFLYLWPKHDNERAMEFVAKLARGFPNDGTALHELIVYTPRLLREGKMNLLEELARDYPETKVGQFSKRELFELK